MAIDAEVWLTVLIIPIYYALWRINGKIGKYDQVCHEVATLKREVHDLWLKVAEVS
jgi:hypothetical protein